MFEIKIHGFDLKNTFENGQCFRFDEYKNGYLGIANKKCIYLEKHGDSFTVDGVTEREFRDYFVDYFDLERDYEEITRTFPKEENLLAAIEYGSGMKILKQDGWEAMYSFIISQNNNITRIKNIISRISEKYGTEISFDGNRYFTFPEAEQLKDVKEADYASLGCGYRSVYLEGIVKSFLDGKIDFEHLKKCGYFSAKEELLKFKGIGPKVADCIALFGLNYLDAFPVDTWIKKVMEELFIKHSASKEEIWQYARENFGEYAGIAQQYLFYYARENKIKGI